MVVNTEFTSDQDRLVELDRLLKILKTTGFNGGNSYREFDDCLRQLDLSYSSFLRGVFKSCK